MESISALLNVADYVHGLKVGPLIAIFLLCIGWFCKWVPAVPNRLIPTILVSFGVLVYVVLVPDSAVTLDVQYKIAAKIVYGFIVGVATWLVHHYGISHLERYLVLKFFPNSARAARMRAKRASEEAEQLKKP